MNQINDINEQEAGFRKAREMYGEEAEAALREFLSNIDEKLYLWMADLYQPRKCTCDNFDEDGNRVCLLPRDENGKCLCTGGGYFITNSARDTDGFEIDIESTVQALNFCYTVGLLRGYGNDYKKAFPKQMQLDVCAFAKSLQDPEDGYFYHPQWGKDITISRQGRDLSWATSILKSFGDMPLYDAKNGTKGSLGAPSGAANGKAEEERGENETWTPQFRTLDAFKEYLTTFDLKNKSYSSGNTFNAQMGQIKARDHQAILDGEAKDENGDGIAEDGFIAAFEKHFNAYQNAENGTWEDELHYNATNGLMKIAMVYNAIGIKLNYAENAFKSAIEMALLPVEVPDCRGKMTTGSVDVYNPWVAMSTIMTNVKNFGTSDDVARLEKLLRDNVVALIKASTEKMKKFKKPDGSFGYRWDISGSTSQGAHVCPGGVIEGDINGGSIATRGIFSNMTAALGLNIPMFLPEDFEKYIARIKERCNYK